MDELKQPQLYDVRTGAPLSIAEEEIPQAVASGKAGYIKGEKVPIITPDGEPGTVSAEQASLAFSRGFRYEPQSAQQERRLQSEYGEGFTNEAKAFGAGALRGASLGLSDVGLTKSGLVSPETLSELEKRNPAASTTGNLTGLIAPLLLTEGLAAPGVAAKTAGKVAATDLIPSVAAMNLGKGVAAKTAALIGSDAATQGLAQKVIAATVPKIAGSAVEGAVYGLGNSVSESALGDPDMNAEKILANVGVGALIGGTIGAGAGALELGKPYVEKALEKGSDLARTGAKKLFSSYLGVPEDAINKYLLNHAEINAAPEFQAVYDHAADHVQGIIDQVADKRLSAEQAKLSFDAYAKGLKSDFKQQGYEARQASQMAKQALKYAQDKAESNLTESVLNTAEPVVAAMEGLRSKVTEGSVGAFKVLESQDTKVGLGGLYKKIEEVKGELLTQGTDEAKAVAAKLESYKGNLLEQYGKSAPAPNIKNLIQGLDAITTYDFNASQFDKYQNRYFKQLRYFLDDSLKEQIPAYRQAMKPLAEDTRLLRELENYGDVESATRRLKSIHLEDRVKTELPLLRKLEEKSGTKFLDAVETYANPERRQSLIHALPEYGELSEARRGLEFFQNPESKEALEKLIRASDEARRVQESGSALEYAQSQKEAIKGLTPSTLQGKLNSAMKGKSIEAQKLLANLPDFEGKSLPELLEHIKTKQAFSADATRGSKHVNLYGMTLGAIFGGIPGAGAGAAAGAVVDRYGPQIAKKLLDSYIRLSNIETMGGQVSKEIARGLRGFMSSTATIENLRKIAEPASVNYITKNRLDQPTRDRRNRDRQEFYSHRFKEVAQAVADPVNLANRVSRNVGTLGQVAPAITASLSHAAMNAAQFLYAKAPKNPNAAYAISPMNKKWHPSDAEISKWERYVTAVDHPVSVIHDLRRGVLSREGVEAIKTVYPKLYSEMVSQLTEHLSDLKEELPYQKRLQIGILFDVPVDAATDPAFIRKMQEAHQASSGPSDAMAGGQAPSNQGISLNNAGKMNISQRNQTDTQRVLNRG